jgi:hypothetical protein
MSGSPPPYTALLECRPPAVLPSIWPPGLTASALLHPRAGGALYTAEAPTQQPASAAPRRAPKCGSAFARRRSPVAASQTAVAVSTAVLHTIAAANGAEPSSASTSALPSPIPQMKQQQQHQQQQQQHMPFAAATGGTCYTNGTDSSRFTLKLKRRPPGPPPGTPPPLRKRCQRQLLGP